MVKPPVYIDEMSEFTPEQMKQLEPLIEKFQDAISRAIGLTIDQLFYSIDESTPIPDKSNYAVFSGGYKCGRSFANEFYRQMEKKKLKRQEANDRDFA